MKKLLILMLVLATGCITQKTMSEMSGVSEQEISEIPSQSKIIYVDVPNGDKQVVFDQILTTLISRDHRIQKEDKERLYISTEGKDIGQSTMQRMTISITEKNGAVHDRFTGEWMVGQDAAAMGAAVGGFYIRPDWQQIAFTSGRYGIAFTEMLAVAKTVENGEISYSK